MILSLSLLNINKRHFSNTIFVSPSMVTVGIFLSANTDKILTYSCRFEACWLFVLVNCSSILNIREKKNWLFGGNYDHR